MNFQFYVEKLFANEHFQKFREEHKKAYPCSAFFVIDYSGQDSKQHFDYWLPGEKKMFSFQLERDSEALPVENFEGVPEEIAINLNFDFNDIRDMVQKRMDEEGIKNKLQKMLFSLQAKNKKSFLVGTVFISGLGMIKVSIDIGNMKILDFEKKSFFDIMKVKKKKDGD